MEIIRRTINNLGVEVETREQVLLQRNCPECSLQCKSKKDCFIKQFRQGINKERIGSKWKPTTDRTVALQINKHPILKNSDIELDNLLKECKRKHFGIFWWATKIK
jgi:hypothetical protein